MTCDELNVKKKKQMKHARKLTCTELRGIFIRINKMIKIKLQRQSI